MNVTVLGATGRTGRLLTAELVRRGHAVTVVARDPARLGALADDVRVVTGSVTDPAVLDEALRGAHAVTSALGPTARDATLHTVTAQALVAAMPRHGLQRLVGVSGAGIDVPGDRKGRRDRMVSWLVRRIGGPVAADKQAEHAVYAASSLEWTLVRPPRLLDGPASGLVAHDAHRPPGASSLRRADLAVFLADVLESGQYVRAAPFVAQGRRAG
jgi:putative NADH-flavin reductase